MDKKKALIAGITGQDGSYLAEILLDKGYDVHGIVRRSATGNTKNIEHIKDKITLHRGDLADPLSLRRVVNEVRPVEIYNEADQDHVGWSEDIPSYSFDITGSAVGRFLEIVRDVDKNIKYFQPVSSNIFGRVDDESIPQTEETPRRPQSPYACCKSLALDLVRYYRDVFGLFASTGIFYNHESPRRTDEYVTHKITKAAVRIAHKSQDKLFLGDTSIKIDFGYAKEYMGAAHNIMQLQKPDDFIICTGELHSVYEFAQEAFKAVGLKAEDYIEIDPKFLRPGKTSSLFGNYSKATKAFGFRPQTKMKDLVRMLIENDMHELEAELSKQNNPHHGETGSI